MQLVWRNLTGKPVRTAALLLLTALLSLTICGGTQLISGLRSGLSSLHARLGAEIMVVPYEAKTKSDLESIVLQGNPGYFYMDNALYEKIAGREGIGQISAQFYLASTSSGCCSIPVQIIGFDPESDFTVTPWLKRSFSGTLQTGELLVGNDLNAFPGDTLSFYGVECRVAAKLDKTGTYYDSAVFTNVETIQRLIRSSLDRGMNDFAQIDPDRVVSCVLINTADGYSPEEVMNDINIHVKKVKAVQTKEMISGIAGSLRGTSEVIGTLMGIVWVLGIIILLLAYVMSTNARRREFAVLRMIGASQGKLAAVVMQEALVLSLTGGLIGSLLALLLTAAFRTAVSEQIGLPFLLPDAGQSALLAGISVLCVMLSGAVSAAVSALRISRIDTALILRGDNG